MRLSSIQHHARNFLERIEYQNTLRLIPFLVASLVAAVTSMLYSRLFFWAEGFAHHAQTHWPWYFSLSATLILVFLSWYLPFRFAKQAGGSGIPQMLIANELDPYKDKPLIRSLIGIKTITMKIVASMLCVLGGGAIGQEGPTLQISSGLFYRIGEFSTRWIQQVSARSFILAGGAAGLAAAFNTPLGGIAYALEELSKDFFNNFKTYVIWSVITTGLLVQTFQGSYLYLGFPSVESQSFHTYLWIFVTSVTAGLLGSSFGALLYSVHTFRKKISFAKMVSLNLLCGGLFWLGIRFISAEGIGGGKNILMNMLFRDSAANFEDFAARVTGPFLMALAGAAGGLFAPTLAIGATLGSLVSQAFWSHNHHLLILCGMIAFLTGFMRTPFTAFILIFEMTDRHSSLFPMMLSAALAMGVAQIFHKHSFYEHVKEDFLNELKEKKGSVS